MSLLMAGGLEPHDLSNPYHSMILWIPRETRIKLATIQVEKEPHSEVLSNDCMIAATDSFQTTSFQTHQVLLDGCEKVTC